MRRILMAVGLLCAAAGPAAAYPDRPVQLIVPFPAGGATDVIARLFAEKLAGQLGGTIVVNNIGGAGGALAASQAAKADADGHTLFFGTTGTLSINQSLYKTLSYRPIEDFRPISLVGRSANILLVHPSVPGSDLREMLAYAKAHPDALSYASAGNGSSTHLAGELLQLAAGVRLTHVPYRGGAPAMADLLSGRVSMMFDTIPTGMQSVQRGGVRNFGTTGTTRSAATPTVPTIGESALPGFDVTIWFALLAPARLNDGVAETLHRATAATLADPALRNRLSEIGVDPGASSPEELAALIRSDAAKWRTVIEEGHVSIN